MQNTPIELLMKHQSLVNTAYTDNIPKYVGYIASDEPVRDKFLTKSNVSHISKMITLKLKGVHPKGKDIVVPDDSILSEMTNISIYYYYDISQLNQMVINTIVNKIRDQFETDQQNDKLNIWVTQYTEDTGLKRYPEIKLNMKHPTRMIFNMNY